MMSSPSMTPPVKLGARPLSALRKVDFPDPVGPQTKTNSPELILRLTLLSWGVSETVEPSYFR